LATRFPKASHALGSAVALLLATASATAQVPEPVQRELTPDERARELYLRGDRLYAEGSYDEAIAALEQAYDLSHRSALLYDIANALERLGRYEEALRYLNDYAPSAPEHQRHIVLKRIRSLEARAEEQRRADRARGERAAPPVEAPAAAAAPSPVSEPASGPPPPVLGYVIAGAGLVSIGAGVVLGLSASSARDEAEGECVNNGAQTLCPASAHDALSAGRNRAIAADIAWGVGLVAVGVGVYLVLDADSESGATTALRSTAAPGGAGVSLVHTF
jgi:tetratricopeptide (TPR) repeat protein